MNVYDFDGTILYGDSEIYLFLYVIKNKLIPNKQIRILRRNMKLERIKIFHKHISNIYRTRRRIYHTLKYVKNMDSTLENFWNEHEKYIKPFYLEKKKEDDVISSATPDFILKPIMKRLGIKYLFATPFDMDKFEIIKDFNHKENKVLSFRKVFKDATIDEFYSDSNNDRFLAKEAKKAFKVKDDLIEEWILE